MNLNKSLKKKFNKIYRMIRIDKLFHKEEYYFNDGQVEEIEDIKKDGIRYSVIKLNTDTNTNNYLVYFNILNNNKMICQQNKKEFDSRNKANTYYIELINYINNTSTEEIVNHCFQSLSQFSRKNIFTRIIGLF